MTETLIPAAASVTAFLLIYALLSRRSADLVRSRFQAIVGSESASSSALLLEEPTERPFVERLLLPAMERLSRSSQFMSPANLIQSANERLVQAGLIRKINAWQWVGLCAVSGMCSMAAAYILLGRNVAYTPLIRLIFALVAFYPGRIIPMFLLARLASRRIERIRHDLPFVADLMAVGMGAGYSFDAAMAMVVQRTQGPLTREFALTMNEIRLGRPRLDAIRDMPLRTGVDDMKAFVSPIIQASRTGGSVTRALQIQAEVLRTRQRQRAQEKAHKAPVKILFPLIFFIFPAIFIVVLGPGIMQLMKTLNGL